MPAFDGRGAQRQPRRLVKARMGPLVQHRHGRVRKRDCWLTKKTMHGCTTLQLRWAIVHIYQIEGLRGWAAIGRRFQELFPGACRGVGSKRNTCQRVVQLWLRTGHVCPGFFKSEGDRGGGPKITAAVLDFIALHAKANPAMYVRHDLVPLLRGMLQLPGLSESAVYAAMHMLGFTHKSLRRINREKNPEMIGLFMHRMGLRPHHRDLFCFDESACDGHTLWKRYGWSLEGLRSEAGGDLRKGTRFSVLALTSCTGLINLWIKEGSFKAHDMEEVAAEMAVLLPGGSTTLCDNAIVHHNPRIRTILAQAGIAMEFTPPYCPEFQPTECFFSSMKAALRRYSGYFQQLREEHGDAGARLAIRLAAMSVPNNAFKGWWRKCGYIV